MATAASPAASWTLPNLSSETERSRSVCGVSPSRLSIDRHTPVACCKCCIAAPTSSSSRSLACAATVSACARSRVFSLALATALSACSVASLARWSASNADAKYICSRASEFASGAGISSSRRSAAWASSTLATCSALSFTLLVPTGTSEWPITERPSFPGKSSTSERTDQRSGAASRRRGFHWGCTANINGPACRLRSASRRSLRRSMSQSHAPAQGPTSASKVGLSTAMASSQTQPALGKLANNFGINSRNSSADAGWMHRICRARYRSVNSVRCRSAATGACAGQNMKPSQGSVANSNCRRRRCHSSSPTGPSAAKLSWEERTGTTCAYVALTGSGAAACLRTCSATSGCTSYHSSPLR